MKERPIGVSILAVFHAIGGLFILGAQLLLLSKYSQIAAGLQSVGIPPMLLMAGMALLGVLAVASGVGMSMGTRWGWWLATFYYVYGVATNINAMFSVGELAEELQGGTRGPEFYYMKFAARAGIHFLLLLYFFKDNVLEYFDMQSESKPKSVGILVGITAAVFAVTTGIVMLTR